MKTGLVIRHPGSEHCGRGRSITALPRIATLVAASAWAAAPALGATFDTGTDLEVSWDNMVRLSAVYQPGRAPLNVAGYCTPGSPVAMNDSSDEGGCSYGRGFTSGRVDWLSELDLGHQGFGLHASSAAWSDAVDRSENADTDSVIYDPSDLGGHHIELYEAFLHGDATLTGDQTVSFRIGRHSLVWGESLYFTENGIAAGQSPIDTYLAQTAGDYRAKDTFLPVAQASFSWQVGRRLAIEGYYQFEWRRSRINPEDAYASAIDVVGAEGNHLVGLSVPGFGTYYYARVDDRVPGSNGQFGLAAKWQQGEIDLGLYGLRFDAKSPEIEFYRGRPAGASVYPQASGTYRLVYSGGTEVYGLSIAGPVGDATFGAEISARRKMPLVERGSLPAYGGDGRHSVGDTLHAQFSCVYVMPPLPYIPGGANWSAEIAANRVLGAVTDPAGLEPGRTGTAAAFRTIFAPQFFQVLPQVDLAVPIGLGYNFLGLSSVVPTMNRGTGDVSVGVVATVDQTWKAAITLTHYAGCSKNSELVYISPGPGRMLSDWDNVALSIQRTF